MTFGTVMSNHEYHTHEALGSSNLKMILENARKFRLVKGGELKIESKSLDFGTAFHTYVLEPEKFDDEVAVFDEGPTAKIIELAENENIGLYDGKAKTRNAKDFKEKQEQSGKTLLFPDEWEKVQAFKEAKGKIIISAEEFKQIQRMATHVRNLPNMDMVLKNTYKELSFFGEIDGVKVKCRPDFMGVKGDKVWVFDLKTTADEATAEAFAKTSANFKYFMQEALYREVLRQNGLKVVSFSFIVASKKEYSTALRASHSHVALEYGNDLVEKAIQKYKYCSENNLWLESPFDFVENKFLDEAMVDLPNWVYYQYL